MSTQPFTNWQNDILKLFTPKNKHSQMILAIDPDDLMQDDSLLALLLAQNYDILPLGDVIRARCKIGSETEARGLALEALLPIWPRFNP